MISMSTVRRLTVELFFCMKEEKSLTDRLGLLFSHQPQLSYILLHRHMQTNTHPHAHRTTKEETGQGKVKIILIRYIYTGLFMNIVLFPKHCLSSNTIM